MNRQHTNSEDTITTLFVEILMPMSKTWRIHEQTTQPLVENQRKPDVIIRTEVLGITETERPDVHEGLALLRKMLCQEPSIHGGKKSKVKLDAF